MSAKTLLVCIVTFFLLLNIGASFKKIPIAKNRNAGCGSYGVMSTTFENHNLSSPKVFFMGNSVYHGTEVIPKINTLQEEQETKFQTGNFGFTGASVYDYIFNYNHIRKFKPDLVVVQFNPTSFGYEGPYYRNDGKNSLFVPSQICLLKESFVRSSFTKDEYSMALCHSLFPLARISKIEKSNFHAKMKSFLKKISSLKLWTFIPNRINAAGEWAQTNRNLNSKADNNSNLFIFDSGEESKQQYVTAKEALLYFIDQLNRDNQKAIFIIQPSGFTRLPIMDELNQILADEKQINFADHHHFFDERLYDDKIHPNSDGASKDARRHYRLIANMLTK